MIKVINSVAVSQNNNVTRAHYFKIYNVSHVALWRHTYVHVLYRHHILPKE